MSPLTSQTQSNRRILTASHSSSNVINTHRARGQGEVEFESIDHSAPSHRRAEGVRGVPFEPSRMLSLISLSSMLILHPISFD
jgi:hypothetical protein